MMAKTLFFLSLCLFCFFNEPVLIAKHFLFTKPIISSRPYDETVSLGFNCQVAHYLRKNGIRKNAYPFDWIVSPIKSLESFIINNGTHFLDKDKITYIRPHDDVHYAVLDNHYGFELYHDFLGPENIENYHEVKKKYEKRIKRFFDLLNSNKKILFIRINITREKAKSLDHIIHTLYPHLEYTLLVLNNTEDFKIRWGLPRIANFFMNAEPFTLVADERWKEVLGFFTFSETLTKVDPEPSEKGY